jgi:hypothetical protein
MSSRTELLEMFKADLLGLQKEGKIISKPTKSICAELVSLIGIYVDKLEDENKFTQKVRSELIQIVKNITGLEKRSAQNYIAIARKLNRDVLNGWLLGEKSISYSNTVKVVQVDRSAHHDIINYAGHFKSREMKVFINLVVDYGLDKAKEKYFHEHIILKKYTRIQNDIKFLLEHFASAYVSRYEYLSEEKAIELEQITNELARNLVVSGYCFTPDKLIPYLQYNIKKPSSLDNSVQ